MPTRRSFLKFAAILSGATGISGFLPDSIQRALAIEPAPGSTWLDAEHIVILMQENRSFDHAFGTLRGVRGFNDPRALKLANGDSVFIQTEKSGASYAPWRLDIRDTRVTWMGSLPHSRNSQVDAWSNGQHDGWLDAKRSGEKDYAHLPLTMGHYTREDLPFYYTLADAFTICDQHYCSVMTSTSPNRCFLWTGTIREKQTTDAKVHMRNEQIDPGGMTWKTFPERLQEAGVSWKSYQNELTRSGLSGESDAWLSNYGDNTLECFSAFNVEAYPGFAKAAQLELDQLTAHSEKLADELAAAKDPTTSAKLRAHQDDLQQQMNAVKAAMADCGNTRYEKLTDEQKALHHAAFVTNTHDKDFHALEPLHFEEDGKPQTMMVPKGDVLYQFRKDVEEGKLPTVSWLTAPEHFSDHPSSPWYGAWYVSEVMDILTKNPEVWKKTIFILTYDENDGYFDHAPSFVAADPKRPETGGASEGIDFGLEYTYKEDELRMGVAEEEARSGPMGLGFRVPMIIASPWSRGGWVNSQVFDHTSSLTFLERYVREKFGKTVREENISEWRRTATGDLTSVFRPHDPMKPALDFLDRDRFVLSIEKARYKEIPSNYRKLTAEEIATINRDPMHSEFTAHQEPGVRPSCALPYELYADGSLRRDEATFEISLRAGSLVHGTGSSGAPFNIYLRNLKAKTSSGNMQASTYVVKAGDTISKRFPISLFDESGYCIEVMGPNGFYRCFKGTLAEPGSVETQMFYEGQGANLTGNGLIKLRNVSAKAGDVTVTDNTYGAKSITRTLEAGEEATVVLPFKSSHGWYDFTVTAEGSSAEARFAGRVENGEASFSDPLMGGVIKTA